MTRSFSTPKAHHEFVNAARRDQRTVWIQAVWDRYRGRCAGCGSDERVAVRMVVPKEAGGQYVPENGVLTCRACEVATTAVRVARERGQEARCPLNVWISRRLYTKLQKALESGRGFCSMGALVRHSMELVVRDPECFSDLEQYQDEGTEVKINMWVGADTYERFKSVLSTKDMTVTDGIKALILLYLEEGAPRTGRRKHGRQ